MSWFFWYRRHDWDSDTIGILDDKVLHNQGDGVRAVTPKRVSDVSIVM